MIKLMASHRPFFDRDRMPFTKYVELGNKEYDRLSDLVRASYPNSCIVWIEEVTNPELRQQYELQRNELMEKRGGFIEERELFHGTNEHSIHSIVEVGFDPSLNKASVYGLGTYFARDAKYSFSYMVPNRNEISYMFLADVLVGNMMVGGHSLRIPPTHDTAVNGLQNPSIFVTPYRYGAYPKYIIAFHKNAK
jgi:poly [ADP-ribose] polymerase 7/11/12/13